MVLFLWFLPRSGAVAYCAIRVTPVMRVFVTSQASCRRSVRFPCSELKRAVAELVGVPAKRLVVSGSFA